MRMFSRYNGIPNSHLSILLLYIVVMILGIVSFIGLIFQDIFLNGILNMDIDIFRPVMWKVCLGLALIITLMVAVTDIVFAILGYRSRYQVPLHRIVRAFYKRGRFSYTQDSTGKLIDLSSTELSLCNLAIRCSYLKPFSQGLKFIVPCFRWGFNGIANSIIDNLRSRQGNLNSAQHIFSSNFPDYRIRISHYHFVRNKVVWYLIRK